MLYDGSGHQASFVLPPVALRELDKPRPSLRDTTADLEEIMAYGEEEQPNNSIETGISSNRWEPDVSLGAFFRSGANACQGFVSLVTLDQ